MDATGESLRWDERGRDERGHERPLSGPWTGETRRSPRPRRELLLHRRHHELLRHRRHELLRPPRRELLRHRRHHELLRHRAALELARLTHTPQGRQL